MGDEEENMQISAIRLDQQFKYKGNILEICEDRILINGHEAGWDFIHHDGVAAALPVADDGKILMVRQYCDALDRYTLGVPADKLDESGELKVECAFWELEEETEYGAKSPENLEHLMSLITTIAPCDKVIDIFVAYNLVPSHQHLDGDQVINVVLCSLEELEDVVYAGKVTDGRTIAAVMTHARKYRSENKKDSIVRGWVINHEFPSYGNGGKAVAGMLLTCKLGQKDGTWE